MADEPKKQPKSDKVKTTITVPADMVAELTALAERSGIGWTQMLVFMARQALDAQKK